MRTLKLEELMEQQVIDKETTEEAHLSLETLRDRNLEKATFTDNRT